MSKSVDYVEVVACHIGSFMGTRVVEITDAHIGVFDVAHAYIGPQTKRSQRTLAVVGALLINHRFTMTTLLLAGKQNTDRARHRQTPDRRFTLRKRPA